MTGAAAHRLTPALGGGQIRSATGADGELRHGTASRTRWADHPAGPLRSRGSGSIPSGDHDMGLGGPALVLLVSLHRRLLPAASPSKVKMILAGSKARLVAHEPAQQ